MKKIISLLCSLIIITASVSSCGNNNEKKDNNNTTTTASVSAADDTAKAADNTTTTASAAEKDSSASESETTSKPEETTKETSETETTAAPVAAPESTKETASDEVKPASASVAQNSVEMAANLKFGWNLGNTLDATGTGLNSETSWGQPKTTKELIQYIKKCGFTSIRIPVSWSNHVNEDNAIDAAWMARVKEVVDYAYDSGLYIILNSHHDCDRYYPSDENFDKASEYIRDIWYQISYQFADYDERLIFESMNEPRLMGTNIEWWFQPNDAKGVAAIKNIVKLNQVFVDTVRKQAKGHNSTRFLMVPSYAASPDFALNSAFEMPTDTISGKLIVSVHAYSPYDFAMNKNGYNKWDGSRKNELGFIRRLDQTFIQKGYGVVIGEFGATNKNNLEDRCAWAKDYTSLAASYGISCFLWDNGGTDVGEENFGMIDRNSLKVYFPELLDAYLSGYAESGQSGQAAA